MNINKEKDKEVQKKVLSIAIAGLALCTAANAAVITLISSTVNDGSFEESYSTVDGTGYLKFNSDTTMWDLSNANTSTRGIMGSPQTARCDQIAQEA